MKQLSVESGLGETFVRDLLERDRTPSLDNFAALAHTMGWSPADLLREEDPESDSGGTPVPLLSWVSAGKLVESNAPTPMDNVPVLFFPDLKRGDYFALKVQGDSMDRVSPDGSIIVINRAERSLERGKPYVFSIRGESTYKVWEPLPQPRLKPLSTNPNHEPIFVDKKAKPFVVGRVRRTFMDL